MPDAVAISLLIGASVLVLAAVGLVAFRAGRARGLGESAAPPAPEGIGEDAEHVLRALRHASVVIAPDGSLVRATASAQSLGLLRDGALGPPALVGLVEEARREGGSREVAMTLPRGRTDAATRVSLQVMVTTLTQGRVLVLAEDRTAAKRLDAVRRDFVANVSHELKTPVGAVSLLAETIETAAEDPVAVRRFAHRMAIESTRLSGLVQDIIDLSRLQEPDAMLHSATVDVDGVIAEAVDRMRVESIARTIKLVTGGSSGLQVLGDHALLVTALRNLIGNALHYSEPGTRVAIATSVDEEGMVEVAVVDQGIGISADDLPRVFERFYRVDPARSRETGGTGLGLSIVKHVAADHGGEVRVWSTPGKGSTFTLRLPQIDEALIHASAATEKESR